MVGVADVVGVGIGVIVAIGPGARTVAAWDCARDSTRPAMLDARFYATEGIGRAAP